MSVENNQILQMINSDLRLFLALGIVGVFVEWQSAHAQVPMTSFNDFYQSSMTSGLPQIPNNLAAAPELGETSEQIAFNSLSSRYPWKLNIGLTANYSYNSNINAMPNGMRGDTFTQSGFLQAAYGAIDTPLQVAGRFVLGYKKYLAHSAYDGQTDDLDLSVNWKPTEKFSFTFSIGFVDGLGSMLGSGAQTSTSSITTNHSGRYQIDEKLSTGYNLSFNALLASSSMNYSNENVALFLDYQLGSKMQLGLSAGSGFRSINGTEIDSNFGIHGAYQPTEKLNINEAIALGVRSYSMGSDSFYPSIQIGAQYYLRDQTGLNLSLFNSLGSGLLMNSENPEK